MLKIEKLFTQLVSLLSVASIIALTPGSAYADAYHDTPLEPDQCLSDYHPFDNPETISIEGPHLCLQAPFPGSLSATNLNENVLTVLGPCLRRVGDIISNVLSNDTETYRFEVTLPPGEIASAHYHPGLLYVSVVEGEVIHRDVKIENGKVTIHSAAYTAGQSFFETPFVVTDVGNASSTQQAKFSVFVINVKGQPPIVPSAFPTLGKLPKCENQQ